MVTGVIKPVFVPIVGGVLIQRRHDDWLQYRRRSADCWVRLDVFQVLLFPSVRFTATERLRVIDAGGDHNVGTGPDVEAEPCIRLAFAGENEHHRPIRAAKHACVRFFVRHARSRTISGMRMHPDSSELLRPSPRVNLLVEEVGDRFIVKRNMSPRADLFDKLHVLDE